VRKTAASLCAAAVALALGGAAPPPLHVNGGRLKDLLLGLAEFGKNPEGGVSRLGFSKEEQAARAWLVERMKEAGLGGGGSIPPPTSTAGAPVATPRCR